jgi:hypothetical protein
MIFMGIDTADITTPSKDNNIIYIAFFLISILIINAVGGLKATYYYLLLVILGVLFVNVGKYNIRVTTPEIMKG